MKRFIIMMAFLTRSVLASEPAERLWYDAFDGCKPQSEAARTQAFMAFEKSTPAERHLSEELDVWLEPVDPKLPATIKIIRATLGAAYRTPSECQSNLAPIPHLNWRSPARAFGKNRRWYRAFLHKRSCDRAPVSLDALTGWVARDFARRMHAKRCTIQAAEGPEGTAALLKCGDSILVSVDTRPGCEFALELFKQDAPDDPVFREQFGWEK